MGSTVECNIPRLSAVLYVCVLVCYVTWRM